MIISIESSFTTSSEKEYLIDTSMKLTEKLTDDGLPAVHLCRYALNDVKDLLPIIAQASANGHTVITQNMGKLILSQKTSQLPDVFIFLEMAEDKFAKLHIDQKKSKLNSIYRKRKKNFTSYIIAGKDKHHTRLPKPVMVNNMRRRIKDVTNQ